MTTYATRDEFRDFGLPAVAVEELSDEQLDGFLDGASAFVDSYIRGRYQLPDPSAVPPILIPGEIRRATIVIATYDLVAFRGIDPESAQDKLFVARYDSVIAWLEQLRDGKLHIDLPSTSSSTDGPNGYSVQSLEPRGWL